MFALAAGPLVVVDYEMLTGFQELLDKLKAGEIVETETVIFVPATALLAQEESCSPSK